MERLKTYEGFRDWLGLRNREEPQAEVQEEPQAEVQDYGEDEHYTPPTKHFSPDEAYPGDTEEDTPSPDSPTDEIESEEEISTDGIPRTSGSLKKFLKHLSQVKKEFDFIVRGKFDIRKYFKHVDISIQRELMETIVDHYENAQTHARGQKGGHGGHAAIFVEDPVVDVEDIMRQINERKKVSIILK